MLRAVLRKIVLLNETHLSREKEGEPASSIPRAEAELKATPPLGDLGGVGASRGGISTVGEVDISTGCDRPSNFVDRVTQLNSLGFGKCPWAAKHPQRPVMFTAK